METKKKTSQKTNKKPKKSSKAKQIDNAKRSPEEKRQQMIDEIVEKTGLGENEILEAEEKFMEEYPDGRISLEQFIDQSDVSIQRKRLHPLLTKLCGLRSWGPPNQKAATAFPLLLQNQFLVFFILFLTILDPFL